jgi:hypothetical protein
VQAQCEQLNTKHKDFHARNRIGLHTPAGVQVGKDVKGNEKVILNGVSGYVQPNHMLAMYVRASSLLFVSATLV